MLTQERIKLTIDLTKRTKALGAWIFPICNQRKLTQTMPMKSSEDLISKIQTSTNTKMLTRSNSRAFWSACTRSLLKMVTRVRKRVSYSATQVTVAFYQAQVRQLRFLMLSQALWIGPSRLKKNLSSFLWSLAASSLVCSVVAANSYSKLMETAVHQHVLLVITWSFLIALPIREPSTMGKWPPILKSTSDSFQVKIIGVYLSSQGIWKCGDLGAKCITQLVVAVKSHWGTL